MTTIISSSIVILLSLFSKALALECYVCDSHVDKTCADPFSAYHTPSGRCPDEMNQCMKFVTDNQYLRGCVPSEYAKTEVKIWACDEDLCNSNKIPYPSVHIMICIVLSVEYLLLLY